MPATAPLTDEQVRHFHDEGYLVVEDVLDDATLEPVKAEVTGEIDTRAAELIEQGELSRDYAEHDFEHRLTHITQETIKVYNGIVSGRLCGPAFFDLIRNPNLLDIAAQLCGDELIASSVYRLRPKVPGLEHGEVPWHQDSGYFDPYCDDALVLTVWLPLVDATEDNGCLWVQPRAHRRGIMGHHRREGKPYLRIDEGAMPADSEPVCCPVPKGGVLLLTNMTPHASFENRSDIVRWSMDLRYQGAKLPTNAKITRLAGEVTTGADVPQACYPPEADFLVRSSTRPAEVVTDASVFAEMRTRHLYDPWRSRWG